MLGCMKEKDASYASINFYCILSLNSKELLEKPHMFIHLNLIIALLCAYTVFGLGIELANNSIVSFPLKVLIKLLSEHKAIEL